MKYIVWAPRENPVVSTSKSIQNAHNHHEGDFAVALRLSTAVWYMYIYINIDREREDNIELGEWYSNYIMCICTKAFGNLSAELTSINGVS